MIRTVLVIPYAAPVTAQEGPQQLDGALLQGVAHEASHAVLREFNLLILGPQENIAEDFAMVLVSLTPPDRAWRVICPFYRFDPDRYAPLRTATG
ncbi:MAG: hypothetical protein AAGK77_05895 [Pseudomonadota bacterium]